MSAGGTIQLIISVVLDVTTISMEFHRFFVCVPRVCADFRLVAHCIGLSELVMSCHSLVEVTLNCTVLLAPFCNSLAPPNGCKDYLCFGVLENLFSCT